jgi:hypothetical protein
MDRVTVEIEASEEDEVKTMRSAEGRGRTLDEAVDAALIELGESRRNVDVKVLSEGSEETVVEVTVIEQATSGMPAAPADGKGEMARTLVEGLLKHMGSTWAKASASSSTSSDTGSAASTRCARSRCALRAR